VVLIAVAARWYVAGSSATWNYPWWCWVRHAKSRESWSVNFLPNEIQRIIMIISTIIIIIIIIIINVITLAVPWPRQSVAVFSTWRSLFDHRQVPVEFVLDKEALGKVFLRTHLSSPPFSIIPPLLQCILQPKIVLSTLREQNTRCMLFLKLRQRYFICLQRGILFFVFVNVGLCLVEWFLTLYSAGDWLSV
jgi:hypothetical protein